MMTAGRRAREPAIALIAIAFVAVMHGVALLALARTGWNAVRPDIATLIAVTATIFLSFSAMLSQALENVTRAFYSRSDLELILSSPARAPKLFAVRIGAMALSVAAMSLLIVGPFIDVMAWHGGRRWLGAYGVLIAASLVATALAVMVALSLFRTLGPKRTRLVAQVLAALIGGAFVVGMQVAAMFSTGSLSRFAFLRSSVVAAHAPGASSLLWWPARAALGDLSSLAFLVAAAAALFLAVTILCAPRFADCTIAAAGLASAGPRSRGRVLVFRAHTPGQALRRKEWLLLLRDPWLISQSLMQLLYLLPPALLLWRTFAFGGNGSAICVPVLIMAAGQLAGGLAWLTVSGEDAPDLVASAPVPASRLLRAKIEAVVGAIAAVFSPFLIALAFVSPRSALVAACGIAASAWSATAIQLWFRSQAKRSQFRRRHTSSRIATFAEAFSSISWAASGAIAAAGSWLALIMVAIALAIVATVRRLAPAGSRAGGLAAAAS
jgi:ABC-2 type transport system permease protein